MWGTEQHWVMSPSTSASHQFQHYTMFTIMHLSSPLYSLDMDSLATKEVGGG